MKKIFFSLIIIPIYFFCCLAALAEESKSSLEERIQQLEVRVAQLEKKLEVCNCQDSASARRSGAIDFPIKLKTGGYESPEEAKKWDFGE
jgi:hypothetical protein